MSPLLHAALQPMPLRLCSIDLLVFYEANSPLFHHTSKLLSQCLSSSFWRLSVLVLGKFLPSNAMKARVKNSLANFLRNEPAWPNSEESIGEFIKMIDGKRRCWKATGRAREIFEILAKDIKLYADECVDSIPGSHWVTWSIYMIGKSPQTAVPVLMFFCEEQGSRKKVQDCVKQSEILKKYPGIKTGNAALPPDLEQLEPLASDTMPHGDIYKISLVQNKIVVEFHHSNATSTRTSTAGGVVHLDGDAYVFTAGHLFYEVSTSGSPKEPKVSDDKWEIDNDSDSQSDSDMENDSYDKGFVELTSRASKSSSDDDDGSSDKPSPRSSHCSDSRSQVNDQFSSLDQATSCQVITIRAPEDITPAIDDDGFEPKTNVLLSSTATRGQLMVLSADLDYALIRFKGTDFNGDKDYINLLRPTHVVSTAFTNNKIIKSTISGGSIAGTLNGTPSYTRLPNSMTFQKVYTVRLNGALVKGDCGSWIIDAVHGGLYGHIIAGSESTATAYIMSAHEVFEDAQDCLGGQLLLGFDSAPETISSSTGPPKTAVMKLTRKAAVLNLRGLVDANSLLHLSVPDCFDNNDALWMRDYQQLQTHLHIRPRSPNLLSIDKNDVKWTHIPKNDLQPVPQHQRRQHTLSPSVESYLTNHSNPIDWINRSRGSYSFIMRQQHDKEGQSEPYLSKTNSSSSGYSSNSSRRGFNSSRQSSNSSRWESSSSQQESYSSQWESNTSRQGSYLSGDNSYGYDDEHPLARKGSLCQRRSGRDAEKITKSPLLELRKRHSNSGPDSRRSNSFRGSRWNESSSEMTSNWNIEEALFF